MCNRRNMDICGDTHMSFHPPINLNFFFPRSHDLRQKDTVQDNRYVRISKAKEERDTAAEEVLSPARHQVTHTALLGGHQADGAAMEQHPHQSLHRTQGHTAHGPLPTASLGGCPCTHTPQALALTFPVGLQHQVSTF